MSFSGHLSAVWWRLRSYVALANARRDTLAKLDRTQPKRILIVCHGNIFRSAFVAVLLRQKCPSSLEIRSAGFHEVPHRTSPPAHVAMSARFGVSLESHRSSVVTPADLAWADTIVLMDRRNWQTLRQLGADPDKFVWVGALDGDSEVPDPYGLPATAAWQVVQHLNRCSEALAEAITRRP